MEHLKHILAQEDTVLFVGSGLSIWSGLPTWPELIEELAVWIETAGDNADLVRAEARRGDYLQAASYGFDAMTKPQIGDFIRTACRYGIAKPHAIHRKLVSLGPTCYVTTNYDNLIEEGLRLWRSDLFFSAPITNRHLTEMAEIVHARASNFVFKPHGDASDSASIILTREQYRQLLPQGDRHSALESLKMLLASRPVVYLGFGLRDPDFTYVRDLLANTFKGGSRDHYALMPDILESEKVYWRRQYGIHLVSYTTTEGVGGARDHSALLDLLDILGEDDAGSTHPATFDPEGADEILGLARHAAALARYPQASPEFNIRVHATRERHGVRWRRGEDFQFNNSTVREFLDSGPARALLIGLPGSGKSYALQRAAARRAETLNGVCLSEPFDKGATDIPVFVDLKLYRGSLVDLVSHTLPTSLPLEELARYYRLTFFLDSFNEMPRAYWEDASYESDFANFIHSVGDSNIIIGSRTLDGLEKLGFPAYHLDYIEDETVSAELQRIGVNPTGLFKREVRQLLRRPFYFRLVLDDTIRISNEAHPRDFFHAFVDQLEGAFTKRFNHSFDIGDALSITAYNALNNGEEVFPLAELLEHIVGCACKANESSLDAEDVANWLVSTAVMIPYSGRRIAFVHQSITEYLAASELARRYLADPQTVQDKLFLTRWDQALFLTLSLLPKKQAHAFLQDVMRADFVLAMKATKYLETGRNDVVSMLLDEIPSRAAASSRSKPLIEWAMKELPVELCHEAQIRELVKIRGDIGGAAVSHLASLRGEQVKDELLQLLGECSDDYSMSTAIGQSMRPFATEEDIETVVGLLDRMQASLTSINDTEDNDVSVHGLSRFLSGLELSLIQQHLPPQDTSSDLTSLRNELLSSIAGDQKSTAGLEYAGDLLLKGVPRAEYAIYSIGEYSDASTSLSWSSFTDAHVRALVKLIESESTWSCGALIQICSNRPDLAKELRLATSGKTGLAKAVLLVCAEPEDQSPIFHALEQICRNGTSKDQVQEIRMLDGISLDWTGNEELFVRLLKLQDANLARVMLGHSIPVSVKGVETIAIGSIDWLLELIKELDSDQDESSFWVCGMLGSLVADYVKPELQRECIDEFNDPDSVFRDVIYNYVLPWLDSVTTDDLNEDSISYLVGLLDRKHTGTFLWANALGNLATEQFATKRLLPLLPEASATLSSNLEAVLSNIASRHGIRFIVSETANTT